MFGQILGGVGLFLLGMILMTDGLKAAAGNALKNVLGRFTGGPIRGMLSGAALTAMVQSSSATTLATIGFVSAGLLTFPAALGVIFGINIGTTSTGWIVSLLGLKFKIAVIAMPLIGVGALMRLLGPGKFGAYGTALAGFGLIFVGIDILQTGMSSLAERIDPSSFPQGPFFGRILLIIIGIIMTVVMQSSSAAVATTLTALHAEAITLPQAAALVIGQNVGTTVKSLLASIGGSIAVKRTAAAHIAFNVVTAIVAFLLLPLLLWGITHVIDTSNPSNAATGIALFHTAFNVLGVMIFLPILNPFANFIMRLIPEKPATIRATRFLDPTVASTGAVAIEAARRALIRIERDQAISLAHAAEAPIYTGPPTEEVRAGLAQTRDFLARIGRAGEHGDQSWRRHLSVMHALDHLDKLVDAIEENPTVGLEERDGEVRQQLIRVSDFLRGALEPLKEMENPHLPVAEAGALSEEVAAWRRQIRIRILEDSASGKIDPAKTLETLDSVRWIDRIAYHGWRAMLHLHEEPTSVETASTGEVQKDPQEIAG